MSTPPATATDARQASAHHGRNANSARSLFNSQSYQTADSGSGVDGSGLQTVTSAQTDLNPRLGSSSSMQIANIRLPPPTPSFRSSNRVQDTQTMNNHALHSSQSIDPSLTMSQHIVGLPTTPGLVPNCYDQFSDSPGSTRHDEFTNWLFDDLQNFCSGVGPFSLQNQVGMPDQTDQLYPTPFPNSVEPFNMPDLVRQPSFPHDQPAPSLAEHNWLSDTRWRHIVEFLRLFFNESNSSKGHFDRHAIFEGDIEADDHVLSFRSMNAYIASYWHSYHEQFAHPA